MLHIVRAELRRVTLPLLHPFTISGGTVSTKEALLVKLFDVSGAVGYGEAPLFEEPIYLTETLTGAHEVLERFLLPALLGKDIPINVQDPLLSLEEFLQMFDRYRGFEFAKSSIEQALCHLVAQQLDISLQALFGGTQEEISVGESIGIKHSIEELVQEVDQRIEEGYKRIKLKIKPGWDRSALESVRTKYSSVPLMADANSAYTLDDTALFQGLDALDLMMIEQPLSYDDIIDHATLQKAIRTPICLDESILNLRHARQAIEYGACKIINIKPSRVGGPLHAKKIHDWCCTHDVPVWCGGMMETGIGRAFNIALASLPGFTLPADMSPASMLFEYDLVSDPYEVESGMIQVQTKSGLGYTIDESAIERSTVSTIKVSPT